MPWHTLYRFAMLTGIVGLLMFAVVEWRRTAPLLARFQQSRLDLETAQQELVLSQARQQELLERIVGLQAQFVESMEIELFFLSKPQQERPEYPLPEGLRRRFAPGYQPE